MSHKKPNAHNSKKRLSRQVAIAALLSAGIMQPILPVLAAGTLGGTSISNTATATFDDPNGGTNPISVTSNTVSIKVAEIAGITVANSGFTDTNGGSVTTDDILYYDFKITNTGNDATAIFLPDPSVTGGTLNATNPYTIISQNGTTVNVNIPSGGSLTSALSGLSNGGYLKADEYIIVRVAVKVTATNVGDQVSVTLGTTNGNSAGANTEVRTSDIPTTTNATTATGYGEGNVGAGPVNGEQQGTANYSANVGTAVNYKAFATILKSSTWSANTTTTSQDDVIKYGLTLKVDNVAPAGTSGYTVSDLQPVQSVNFSANRDGSSASTKNVVIMSDVIPANTRLAYSSDAGYSAPAVPTDSSGTAWKVWYAYNDVNTDASNSALEEIWTDVAPASLTDAGKVKRIAFVKEGTVAKGVTTTEGTFSVVTTGINSTAGGSVYNMAQVVGQSETGTGKKLVFDESGDANPDNFDGANPGATSDLTLTQFNTDPLYAPIVTGIVTDTTSSNNDPGGNTGSGTGGENNVVTINPLGANLLNGPNGTPGAIGIVDNQDDFTNKSMIGVTGNQSASIPLTAISTGTFTNTVRSGVDLNNVVIRPVDPTTAAGADNVAGNDASYGTCAALPDGTQVEIGATVVGVARTALYTLAVTGSGASATCVFNFTSSTTGGSGDSTKTPIIFTNFAANTSVSYTVKVTLPATGANTLQGYTIPVVAYVEGDGAGLTGYGDFNKSTDQAPNVTIDRLYTGFMQVEKKVRVLNAAGTALADPSADWTATPTYAPKPGEILEYQITYKNLASGLTGNSSGSVTLSASNFKVVEDGLGGSNSWGSVTNHVMSKAIGTGTVNYYTGNINLSNLTTNVASEADTNTGYLNSIGTVAPQASGTFTFQRKLK